MSVKDEYGITPIFYAAWSGYLEQVPKEFLTLETMLVKDKHDETPLHWAALKGQLNKVPVALLTLKTMLVKNKEGNTPLHYATLVDKLELLRRSDFKASAEARRILGEKRRV